MNKQLFSILAVLVLTGSVATAQSDTKEKKEKSGKAKNLGEYEEIIIKKKDGEADDVKVVIDIQGDKVLVNGTPIDKYVDEKISVHLRQPLRIQLSPDTRFRNSQFSIGGERAFLGVSTEGSSEGARVVNVTENSAAAKAGLKSGDVITRINAKEVFDHEQLTEAISALKPDDKVTIAYKRNGKNQKTTATLGKREGDVMFGGGPMGPVGPIPPIPPMPPMEFNFDGNGGPHVFGFSGRPRLGLKAQDTEEGKGVKVLDVDDDSPAEKAGIQEDDIITSFNGKQVNSAEELARASREANDKSTIPVELQRDGKPQTVEVKIPKKLRTAEL